MLSHLIKVLLAFLAFACLGESFSPHSGLSLAKPIDSSLCMFGGKKPVKKPKEADVFGGRGDRITIREDEDNAMWVDEPGDAKKKGKGKTGK